MKDAITREDNFRPLVNPHPALLSPCMVSNLFTMAIAARKDARQALPDGSYVIPSPEVIESRNRLLEEELDEWLIAAGYCRDAATGSIERHPTNTPNLEKMLDAMLDLIYVATGTLAVMGVPDLPHMEEVCERNNAKFPGGEGVTNAEGKYMKPPGWTPPAHDAIRDGIEEHEPISFHRAAVRVVRDATSKD